MNCLNWKRRKNRTKKKQHRSLRWVFRAALVCLAFAAVSFAVLKSKAMIFDKYPDLSEYPCRGAYVTEKTGKINWKAIKSGNISFCYIRATSGAYYSDKNLVSNLKGSSIANIPVGLVHDFDFFCGGELQAENYLRKLGEASGRLIPAVDITMTVYERIRCTDLPGIGAELNRFVDRIKDSIGVGAVLMCDKYVYEALDLERSGALIWAVDEGDCAFTDKWTLFSFSDNGRSAAFADKDARCVMVSAAKNISKDMFYNRYII